MFILKGIINNCIRKSELMRTISRNIIVIILLMLIPQISAQDTINYRTVFPTGIFVGYGLGSYSITDQYVSKQKYSGSLSCFNGA